MTGICAALALGSAGALALGPSARPAPPDQHDMFTQMADEVTAKVLAGPPFQGAAKKPRIVVGDIRNFSDDEGIRVDDVYAEIRNQIVAANAARLFASGELDVDYIIQPVMTSTPQPFHGKRQDCFTLQLTLSTVSGEFVAAQSASHCR